MQPAPRGSAVGGVSRAGRISEGYRRDAESSDRWLAGASPRSSESAWRNAGEGSVSTWGLGARPGMRRLRQMALPQNLHFVAAASTDSLQYGQSFVAGFGASGAGFRNWRLIQNTTKAITMKAITALMKVP